MGIDENSEQLPDVLSEVASIIKLVQQQVIDESRTDILNEMHDSVVFERRQLHVWHRLAATTEIFDIHLFSGLRLNELRSQHACDEWLVACDNRYRYIISINNIKTYSGLHSKAISGCHQNQSCGLQSMTAQIESDNTTIVGLVTGERIVGRITEVWGDCIDLRTENERATIPFHVIEVVQVSI